MTPVSKPELKGLWLSESENVASTLPCLQIISDIYFALRRNILTGHGGTQSLGSFQIPKHKREQFPPVRMVQYGHNAPKRPKTTSHPADTTLDLCCQDSSPLRSQFQADVAEYTLPQLNQVFIQFFFLFTSLVPLISSKPVCSLKSMLISPGHCVDTLPPRPHHPRLLIPGWSAIRTQAATKF